MGECAIVTCSLWLKARIAFASPRSSQQLAIGNARSLSSEETKRPSLRDRHNFAAVCCATRIDLLVTGVETALHSSDL